MGCHISGGSSRLSKLFNMKRGGRFCMTCLYAVVVLAGM